MRTYDMLFILSPELAEDAAATAVEEYRKVIQEAGVSPEIDEAWGRRRLAYMIGRHREGIYHFFRLGCDGKLIAELDRRMKNSENVVRHLAVRIDEDLKRQAKTDKKKKPRTGPPSAHPPAETSASEPPAAPGA